MVHISANGCDVRRLSQAQSSPKVTLSGTTDESGAEASEADIDRMITGGMAKGATLTLTCVGENRFLIPHSTKTVNTQ